MRSAASPAAEATARATSKAIATSSSDEIGEVARAFDQIQGEVLRLAANEAGLRGKLNEMFVDLSCRSQSLVERQIRLIDELEQGEQDTERLANLFKMDHIATRMRRYSQNLLVLAGHELPGRWNEPVTLVNVIRAAVSEIEEYERVSVRTQPDIAVSGPAVNDVVHLIAELAENAASLSAADTPVDISGRPLASGGVLVEVTDQGVGMNPDVMAQANWRLDNPSATDITAYRKMGLFVVGRLAARHGIKVRLQPTDSGGLTALVWLPDAIVVRPATAPARPATAPARPATAPERPATAPERPAGTGPDRVPAEPATSARSLRPAPTAAGHQADRAGHQGASATGHTAPSARAGPGASPRAAGESRGRAPPAHLRGGRVGLVQSPQAVRRHRGGRGQLGAARRRRLARRGGGHRTVLERRDDGRPAGASAAGEPRARRDQRPAADRARAG